MKKSFLVFGEIMVLAAEGFEQYHCDLAHFNVSKMRFLLTRFFFNDFLSPFLSSTCERDSIMVSFSENVRYSTINVVRGCTNVYLRESMGFSNRGLFFCCYYHHLHFKTTK